MIHRIFTPSRAAVAVTGLLLVSGCRPVTEVPFVLEDVAGTYLPAGVYRTLQAVDDVPLCTGSGCASQITVGDFTEVVDREIRECVLSVGGIRHEFRSNGTFQLDATRRQDCTIAGNQIEIQREALTVFGLFRLHGDGSGQLTVIQSAGEGGSFQLEGRLEGVQTVTENGQIIPRYVHLGVRDRTRLEFTMTWTW